MPVVPEAVSVTRVFGVPREGMKRHVFVAANFFMQRMLNRYRDDLGTDALPEELQDAADYTVSFLKEKTARVYIQNFQNTNGRLQADVVTENLSGHKLPTAFPSRRCWLHVTFRDGLGRVLFESGALRPDGSISGNDNDADPKAFEPHYREITRGDQVEIYEDILGGLHGEVTTGLLSAVRYLKDNRLLPRGFDKNSPDPQIAVVGDARDDSAFTGGSHSVRYSVNPGDIHGPITVEAELWYQPIGYRWATNLKTYGNKPEPASFTRFYESMTPGSAEILCHARASTK